MCGCMPSRETGCLPKIFVVVDREPLDNRKVFPLKMCRFLSFFFALFPSTFFAPSNVCMPFLLWNAVTVYEYVVCSPRNMENGRVACERLCLRCGGDWVFLNSQILLQRWFHGWIRFWSRVVRLLISKRRENSFIVGCVNLVACESTIKYFAPSVRFNLWWRILRNFGFFGLRLSSKMTCSIFHQNYSNRPTLIAYCIDYTWIEYDTVIVCCYFRELFVSYIYYDIVSSLRLSWYFI